MTGKQLWESGMVGKVDDDELANGEDLGGIADATEKSKVEA